MKKLILLTLLVGVMLLFGNNLKAQGGFVSLGVETAKPIGDLGEIYFFGLGLSGQAEFELSRRFSATLNGGYTLFFVDESYNKDYYEAPIKKSGLIPLHLGVKYYINQLREGFFLGAYFGGHFIKTTTDSYLLYGSRYREEIITEFEYSVAPELGFFINENFSLALRFNFIFKEERNHRSYDRFYYTYTSYYSTINEKRDGEKNTNYLALKLAYSF